MNFKIDENLPVDLVADLQRAGHNADTVLDENLAGSADLIVLAAALREGRVLLTLDKGIANLIQHPVNTHAEWSCSALEPSAVRRFWIS